MGLDHGAARERGAEVEGLAQVAADDQDAEGGVGRDLTGVALTTGRLVLAAPTEQDVDAITAICQDPEIRAWNRVPSPYTRADAEFFVREVVAAGLAAGSRAVFGMYDAVSGRLLGSVGLYELTGAHARNGAMGEIVYWAAPQARGRGLTTEAVRAVCRWAFAGLGLERIEWSAFAGNHASRRVAQKAGFTFEGVLRSRVVRDGRRCDLWVASLLPGEI